MYYTSQMKYKIVTEYTKLLAQYTACCWWIWRRSLPLPPAFVDALENQLSSETCLLGSEFHKNDSAARGSATDATVGTYHPAIDPHR